jgi:hypothetical protein
MNIVVNILKNTPLKGVIVKLHAYIHHLFDIYY